ncbi:MAG TPA: alpha/beta fold hydrolase [Gemmatimonadaceae bacterium]|nr:alpha/beta fold hydrolase [Gemmatimonadaceae bacterium]
MRRLRTSLVGALSLVLALAAAHFLSARCGAARSATARFEPPQSPASYARAVATIARRQAADDSVAVPGARSILLTDGAPTARAIVLLHGLTDSPRQFETLAYRLHADGNNVFVPRFPRHGLRGGDAGSLAALTASELRGFADSVASEAAGLGDSVIVAGLSMGGTAAAWIAQWREVRRAVLIAPALEPGRVPSILDRPLVGLADRLPELTRREPRDSARPDRELGFSTRATAEILELGASVLREAAHAAPRTQRIVLLVNANDRTVRESAAEALARDWARHGAAVSVFELADSLRLPHNIVDPPHGRTLRDAVLELLREVTRGENPSALVHPLPVHPLPVPVR